MRYRLAILIWLTLVSPVRAQPQFNIIPEWNGTTATSPGYYNGALVKFNGTVWVCSTGSIDPTTTCAAGNPQNNHQWNSMAGALAWDSITTYQPNTMVMRNGNIFSAVVENTNQDPAGGGNINWRSRGTNPSNLVSLPLGSPGFALAWATTPGYRVIEGTAPALGDPASWSPYMRFILNDLTNPRKSAIYIEDVSTSGGGDRVSSGIAIFHASEVDNGHEVSGIVSTEWLNGNGGTFQRVCTTGRPVSLPACAFNRAASFALEVSGSGYMTNIISGAYSGEPTSPVLSYVASVGPGTGSAPWPEGFRAFAQTDATNLDQRVAFRARNVGLETTSGTAPTGPDASDVFLVTFDGSMYISSLKTTGSATGKKVVCVDTATGKLYASSSGTDCSN